MPRIVLNDPDGTRLMRQPQAKAALRENKGAIPNRMASVNGVHAATMTSMADRLGKPIVHGRAAIAVGVAGLFMLAVCLASPPDTSR